jgi:hypothetical protein
MKPLSEMTREELFHLEDEEIEALTKAHKVPWFFVTGIDPVSKLQIHKARSWGSVICQLDRLRLELQQDKAAK